jgi:RHS repeat-associated protein
MVVISDKKIGVSSNGITIDYYNADVISAQDYYPGGMLMPGRKYSSSSSSYRYGFNGQEKSDEIFEGSTTAEYWEYDSRICRRWNMDPDATADESPYAVNRNNPITYSDPDGDFPGLGFLVGVLTELVIQTVEIKLGVRKDYDVKAMVISGVATQLGMGVAKQISRIKTLSSLGTKAVSVIKGSMNVAKDVAINLGEQGAKTLYDPNATVSLTDALVNAGVSKVTGDLAENYAKKTGAYSDLAAKQKRAARINKNNPKASRADAAEKAAEAVEGYVTTRAAVASVPATGAVTRTYDALTKTPSTTDINTKTGTNAASAQPAATVTPAAQSTPTTKSDTPTYTKEWVKQFGKYYKDSESFNGANGTTIKNPYYKKKEDNK